MHRLASPFPLGCLYQTVGLVTCRSAIGCSGHETDAFLNRHDRCSWKAKRRHGGYIRVGGGHPSSLP